MRVEVADGVSLAVDVWPGSGDGAGGGVPPFLLVHGLASNRRMWDGVVDEVGALGRPCAAVDLRGHGESDKPDHGYDFATVVSDLVALIDALGPEWERPVVVGQSWGGNVVVELASRHPEKVRGIGCVDGGEIELWRDFATWEECADKMAPPPLEGRPVADVEAEIRERHPDWPESGVRGMLACYEVRDDGTIKPWLAREHHMQILRALYEHRPSEVLPSIEAPVVMIPASTVEGGDHDLHAQHPSVVAGLLLERFPA